MCGILGIANLTGERLVDEGLMSNMAQCLAFRGPDYQGVKVIKGDRQEVGLVHNRLSIIDLTDLANQPMSDESGRFIITFNGEIYNFNKLKAELSLIHKFKTNSDTEVILSGFIEWGGEKLLSKLDGMFAFCIYDKEFESFFIARDKFGEKPLYYSWDGKLFCFSSDIRSWRGIDHSKDINTHALGYYFSEMSTPINSSIWKGISKLPPANYLIFDGERVEIKEYWSPKFSGDALNEEDAINKIDKLLDDSVKSRIVSDVPFGTLLSGGVDSSLISVYAAKHCGGPLNTFSVGFKESKFNELPYAKQVADLIGANHHEVIVSTDDMEMVDQLLNEYGEPFSDSSQIPTYLVTKYASETVKMCLGGDGGDEVFGGYGTHNQAYRMSKWESFRRVFKFLEPLINRIDSSKLDYFLGIAKLDPKRISGALNRSMLLNKRQLKLMLNETEFYRAQINEHTNVIEQVLPCVEGVFNAIVYGSFKTRLVNDYLVKTDRASMFNSLELRTPFLNPELIDYTSKISSNLLMKNGGNKYLLKKVAEKYFDKEFIYRPKQGFGIPIGDWIKNKWRKSFEEVFYSRDINPVGLRYDVIDDLYERHLSGKSDHTHALWSIYVYHKWLDQNFN